MAVQNPPWQCKTLHGSAKPSMAVQSGPCETTGETNRDAHQAQNELVSIIYTTLTIQYTYTSHWHCFRLHFRFNLSQEVQCKCIYGKNLQLQQLHYGFFFFLVDSTTVCRCRTSFSSFRPRFRVYSTEAFNSPN